MADILYKIYIYLKPVTYEKIVYRSFTAAERACRAGGEIEEWCATEGRGCGGSTVLVRMKKWR